MYNVDSSALSVMLVVIGSSAPMVPSRSPSEDNTVTPPVPSVATKIRPALSTHRPSAPPTFSGPRWAP